MHSKLTAREIEKNSEVNIDVNLIICVQDCDVLFLACDGVDVCQCANAIGFLTQMYCESCKLTVTETTKGPQNGV